MRGLRDETGEVVEPRIIFEDSSMLVIDKPAGMVVNDSASATGITIQRWFGIGGEGEFGKKGGIVHRLDKDTSGVMVLAKTEEAYEKLKKQFLERKTAKTYLALVHGKPGQSKGVVSMPIDRHPVIKTKFAISDNLSRTAITHWSVKQGWPDYSLLELRPMTGRTHQLRVHLLHLGHPIVSDPIYGFKKQLQEDLAWCPRLFLHAERLEFSHPGSGERLTFLSQLPSELEAVLRSLVH